MPSYGAPPFLFCVVRICDVALDYFLVLHLGLKLCIDVVVLFVKKVYMNIHL
jgi:hypothetical protein